MNQCWLQTDYQFRSYTGHLKVQQGLVIVFRSFLLDEHSNQPGLADFFRELTEPVFHASLVSTERFRFYCWTRTNLAVFFAHQALHLVKHRLHFQLSLFHCNFNSNLRLV